jgi:hypothetical protein
MEAANKLKITVYQDELHYGLPWDSVDLCCLGMGSQGQERHP